MMLLIGHGIVESATGTLTVTATVLSRNNCRFTGINAAASTLNFGNLDPSNPVDITATTTIRFRCRGSSRIATFFISDNDGLYETGPGANRMRHTVVLTEYLPYSLNLNPITASVPRNTNQTLTITGTVRGVDYQNAYVGSYSDTVIITIVP